MSTVNSFEDLKVWQKARILNKFVFECIQHEKFSKDYKLREQINGAAGSIMDNIAEGFGRNGNQEFMNFLSIAHGSVMETRSQLFRAQDRVYITSDRFNEMVALLDEISKMINALINYLKKNDYRGVRFKK